MNHTLFLLADRLYHRCYPLYRPLYAGWKALADRQERAMLRQVLRPGMTVVDVGANIGVYTHFLARLVGPTGRVHAFEPASANFRRLQASTAGLSQVQAVHAAVGGSSGSIRLYESDELNVDHRTFDSGDGRRATEVRLVSLDDHLTAGTRVDFIKIDVQGYELQVLQGAQRVFTENARIRLLMEFWPYGLGQAGVEPRAVLDFIRAAGFQVRGVDGREPDLTALDPGNLHHYCNLLLGRPAG